MNRDTLIIATPKMASLVALFRPTRRRGQQATWEAKSEWGKVRVEGWLDQRHRDVIDAVMMMPILDDAAVSCAERPDLRVLLGMKRWSLKETIRVLDELSHTSVTLVDARGHTRISGPLLYFSHGPDGKRPVDWPGFRLRFTGAGCFSEVFVSPQWVALLEEDPAGYTIGVLDLNHGPAQAVARFVVCAGVEVIEEAPAPDRRESRAA